MRTATRTPDLIVSSATIAYPLLNIPSRKWIENSQRLLLAAHGRTVRKILSILRAHLKDNAQYILVCKRDEGYPPLHIASHNQAIYTFLIPNTLNYPHLLLDHIPAIAPNQGCVSSTDGQIPLYLRDGESSTSYPANQAETHELLHRHIPDLPLDVIQQWAAPLQINYQLLWPIPEQPQALIIDYLFLGYGDPDPRDALFLSENLLCSSHSPDCALQAPLKLYQLRNHILLAALCATLKSTAALALHDHCSPGPESLCLSLGYPFPDSIHLQRLDNLSLVLSEIENNGPEPGSSLIPAPPPNSRLSNLLPPSLDTPPSQPAPSFQDCSVIYSQRICFLADLQIMACTC